MDLNMSGHRVIVTAGAAGIGRSTVEAFLNEGARVFACDIDERALDSLASRHSKVGIIRCDISNEENVAGMFDAAIDFLGGLDCLVNNAGTSGPTKPAADVSSSDWSKCVNVNLNGTFYCTKRAITYLRGSKNPSIISLSSAAGRLGYPNKSPYVAAKWGIVGFMKTVSIECGADGIRCNAILPGPVDNPRMKGVIAEKAELAGISIDEQEQRYLSRASLKKFVKPEEIADLIVYLASERARSISGQAIAIDGDLQALA